MSSPYDCCVECPERTKTCHAECRTYADARITAAAQKAAYDRKHKGSSAAASVLVDSRMRFRRKLHI